MRVSSQDVLTFAAVVTGKSVSDLKSVRRTKDFVTARFLAAWALRHACPHLSLPMIGHALGGRDHTTILHACRRAEDLANSDPKFARWVDRIVSRFSGAVSPVQERIDHLKAELADLERQRDAELNAGTAALFERAA